MAPEHPPREGVLRFVSIHDEDEGVVVLICLVQGQRARRGRREANMQRGDVHPDATPDGPVSEFGEGPVPLAAQGNGDGAFNTSAMHCEQLARVVTLCMTTFSNLLREG